MFSIAKLSSYFIFDSSWSCRYCARGLRRISGLSWVLHFLLDSSVYLPSHFFSPLLNCHCLIEVNVNLYL
ncbi:hypothetical protein RchiOBHm_Chr3g0492831 [Rosa chinensis]|uniref:Uncharacterized protein n=1 Tax=Rosa chinensis TaxID=74649 RepID=A0A2P6RGM2_ROSCH|nr:hypothetical protein RchiOBHm_Chr3g0492831 [Rosa chinensis]